MKDGKFEVGDKIECVELGFNAWITRGNKYTIKNVWNEAVCQSIQIANDSGMDTIYPAHLFKLVEPDCPQEYFSALNKKEAEKYIGKVMEFADGGGVRNNKWKKNTFRSLAEHAGNYSFMVDDGIYFKFMRTCPDTFKKKMVKKTVERWVNVYQNGAEKTYRYFIDAMADRDDIGWIACVHLIKEYEVEE